ncbi:MAG: response regulator [Rhodoferax sp.]
MSISQQKLLLAVNDNTVAQLLRTTLRRQPFTYYDAQNLAQVQCVLDEQCPDVMVLDLEMAERSKTFDLFRSIRANPRLSHIYILMLTGRRWNMGHTDCTHCLADSCLQLPFSTTFLEQLVSNRARQRCADQANTLGSPPPQ